VAVNISATAFQSDTLVATVRAALRDSGANPKHLQLEITEHALITDLNVASGKLNALRDMGVRIALDDFGAGYSSMSYLQHLPLDVLKVDRTVVREIDANRNGRRAENLENQGNPSSIVSGFGARCHALLALTTPGSEDRESFSASTCISSSASIISASGICDQRRSCSRRAPSHVVRFQSMSLGWDLSFGIVVPPCTQLFNIRPVLRSIGLFLHPDQRRKGDETDQQFVM
jgi:hypothetical protein